VHQSSTGAGSSRQTRHVRMNDELLMGVDIGTSYSKGVVATPDGRIVARTSRAHDVSMPRPGWAEHDVDAVWWGDLCAITSELTGIVGADRVKALAVSGLGPAFVPLDEHDRPLRPAILYGIDTRATAEIEELGRRYGEDAILERCGARLTSQSVGPKGLWVRRNEPEAWANTRRFGMVASYLVLRLTGEYVLDHQSASHCTPLYDISARAWIGDRVSDVAPGLEMPQLCWAPEPAGAIRAAAAEACGLRAGTPVAVGTIDAWAEATSIGVRAPGEAMLMYGTALTLVQMLAPFRPLPSMWGGVGALPGTWTLAGGVTTAGALTKWFRRLVGDVPYETLLAEASEVPPGSDGLVVLPYFSGERNPFYDPDARGVICGLSLSHGRGHLYRAILEGAAFGARHMLESLAEAGHVPSRLVAVGGGTKGPLWPQIVSDVTGIVQEMPAETVGASYGDAWFAGVASGLVDPDTDWSRVVARVTPNAANRETYDRVYSVFRELYPATADAAHALAAQARDDETDRG
jgi:xylulokinase